jgi:peptide/nickel transport system permease protein
VIAFLVRRLVGLALVLLVLASLLFVLLRTTPGDPARMIAGTRADPKILARVRAEWRLDEPAWVQYGWWMSRLVRFDLPRSYVQDRGVSEILANKVVATVSLALASTLLAIVLGVAAGVAAAMTQGSWLDAAVLTVSLLGISMPVFWLGLMFILLFARTLQWLPVLGYGETGLYLPGLPPPHFQPLPHPAHLVLPSLSLALLATGYLARMTRSSLLEVVRQDYVRTAAAKGLSRARVVLWHALRNALIPVVTIVGINFAQLLGGAVATESIFAWPGLGNEILKAIHQRDYPVVMGGVLAVATVFVAVNLLVDLSYALIDPRVRHG